MAAKSRPSRGKNPAASTAKKKRGSKNPSLETKLVKALTHPMRVSILELMGTGEWSPNQLRVALKEGLGQVSYHVKVLFDLEMIEMSKTEPRRGAVEHFYRAIERAFVPSGVASDIPKVSQSIIGNAIIERIENDASASLASGRFYERDDWHVGWYPADLDDTGCRDAEKLADKFIEDFIKIEAESINRRRKRKDGGEHIFTSAALLIFGSKDGPKANLPSKDGSKGQ